MATSNPVLAMLAAKNGNSPGSQGQGQPGGSGKGMPPQFLNRGNKKKKHSKGKQDAIARRLASMKNKR